MHGSALPRVRVTIVTLDNHLKGAVERADAVLAGDNITLSLHAAADWDRDPATLDRAKAAVATDWGRKRTAFARTAAAA